MKRIIMLSSFVCLVLFSQAQSSITKDRVIARDQFTLGDSVVNVWYSGTLINADYVENRLLEINPNLISVDSITFDTDFEISSYDTAQLYWDNSDYTLNLQTGLSGSTLQIGQELYTLVQNNSGSTIPNGSAVYIYDAGGQVSRIRLADADAGSTSYRFIGVTTSSISHGSMGFVTTFGDVHNLNTAGLIEGNPIYISQTAGQWTQVYPTKHAIRVGFVKYAHNSNGIITVQPHPITAMDFAVLNNAGTSGSYIDSNKITTPVVYTTYDTLGARPLNQADIDTSEHLYSVVYDGRTATSNRGLVELVPANEFESITVGTDGDTTRIDKNGITTKIIIIDNTGTGYGVEFGDRDTRIIENSDDNLRFIVGGSTVSNLGATNTIQYTTLNANTADVIDIGNLNRFRNIYGKKIINDYSNTGTGADTVNINKDGIHLYGKSTQWDEIQFQLTSMKSLGGTDKPDWNPTYLTYDFPQNDTTERMGFSEEMPHWFVSDTGYFMVHFDQTQNLTPVFGVAYKIYNVGATEPANYTVKYSNSLATSYTSGTMGNIAVFPFINLSGVTLGATIKVILYRKDNVYTGDCRVTRFGLHIKRDSFGSNNQYSD